MTRPAAEKQESRWQILAYEPGSGFNEHHDAADLPRLLRQEATLVWLDLVDPTPEEVQALAAQLQLHPLTVEDVLHRNQRSKLDVYDGYQFLVLYAGADLAEMNVFVGPRYLVTLHEAPIPEVETARARWRETDGKSTSIEVALYVLLDSVVDGYFPLLDEIADEITAIEERIFARRLTGGVVQDLLRARKRLLTVRRFLSGERDVVNTLARRELDIEHTGTTMYFLDVYDHLVRVIESLDVYHEMTASALDAHLSVTSFRLNETMKRMTALGTVMMSLAIITGLYGMNFKYMPELEWQYGYPFALGLMAAVAIAITLVFRRLDWL
jgi:magnesium transporter